MKSALDRFEATLVQASRSLGGAMPMPAERRARGRLRRVRQLGLLAQVALAATSFSALGGAATGAYLWLASGSPGTRALASLQCSVSTNGAAIVPTITGDPLIDCAAAFFQQRARRPPRLTAWSNGRQTAVVRPLDAGPPPSSDGPWHRLPAGWTVDLHVVELTDQLNDISAGMADGPACTYGARALRVARALLADDGLPGWRVTLHANNGPLVSGCRHIAPNVDNSTHTIELIQIQALAPPAHVPAEQLRRQRDYQRALASLSRLQARLNHTLGERCESVVQAARLWRGSARADGFDPATAAFWRELHALGNSSASGPPQLPRGFFRRYTLFMQPPGQDTGACAHLLIQDDGDELIVYAARMAP
ncbi:MAG TPA: hypothetical protein VGG41_00725 [Solirubrobacteraceae bacterium]